MVRQLRKRRAGAQRNDSVLSSELNVSKGQTSTVINDSHGDSLLEANDNGNSLFACVKKGRAALQSVVDEWIESYRQDRDSATLELLQFFILASGCKGRITAQMKETMDNGRIIRELVEEFDEKAGGDYPIITNGPQWKKFRTNFCEFINTFIRQCQYSIIYDQYLMESMISFLITLSDSQVRAFRHTATLAAMKLMSTLVDVALTLSINIDNSQRLYDKTRQEKSRGEKLDGLAVKRQELDDNMEDIKTTLDYLFKSVFVHRYRDIVPEIRSLCISEIGIWMRKFPNHFLDDSYLKYFGWTLHDKVGDVRLKCLQSLLPLYETGDLAQKLELFSHKFKERIVSMTLDKEYEVAAQAVKLIISIHKYHSEVLTDKDCEQVYELVYATNKSVAQAAGEFLFEKLSQVDDGSNTNMCSRRGKKLSSYTSLLRDLITFHIEAEIHEHCSYLVDSLIESHSVMKDWECMTDLLLEEPNSSEEALNEKQECVLIDLMSCAVRQTASGEPPLGRVSRKSKTSIKDVAAKNEEKEKISNHFAPIMSALLKKYKTDVNKVTNLLEIPLWFLKNTFSQSSDDLDQLMAVVNEIIEINSQLEVIESCARLYELMQDEDFVHYRIVRVEVGTFLDRLLQRFTEYLNRLDSGDDDELESLSYIARKIVPIIACCQQMDSDEIWNLFFIRWIKDARAIDSSNAFADEITKSAVDICFLILNWRLHNISISQKGGIDVNNERAKVLEFISETIKLLDRNNPVLSNEAYFALCDIFVIFNPTLAHDSPSLPELICRPTRSQMDRMISYLEANVFINEEPDDSEGVLANAAVEECYKKRHILVGFCKLVTSATVPTHYARAVLRFYSSFYNDFGDIIKALISKLREMDRVACAKVMANALIQNFEELQTGASENPDAFTKQDDNFLALKELAKKFALSFGLDNQKNREAISALHREGIHFTFDKLDDPIDPLGPPPNLPFLEILCEFSSKLIKQDKKTVLLYLEKCLQNALPGVQGDEWQPLMTYRNSLADHHEFDISLNRSVNRNPGRQCKSKKRYREDSDEEGTEED